MKPGKQVRARETRVVRDISGGRHRAACDLPPEATPRGIRRWRDLNAVAQALLILSIIGGPGVVSFFVSGQRLVPLASLRFIW